MIKYNAILGMVVSYLWATFLSAQFLRDVVIIKQNCIFLQGESLGCFIKASERNMRIWQLLGSGFKSYSI